MAKENVPHGGDAPENAPPDPLEVLKWTDAAVQGVTNSIISLVRAAKGLLALDATSLMTVADLLDQIDDKAHDIQNGVNYDAERCGVNYTDDERDKLSKKLHDQHHALHKTDEMNHA